MYAGRGDGSPDNAENFDTPDNRHDQKRQELVSAVELYEEEHHSHHDGDKD